MIKLLKDSWALTKNNLILAYPLIFFFWLIAMMIPSMKGLNITSSSFILIALNIAGLMLVFWSGWFSMFAKVAIEYKKDPKIAYRKEYSFGLLKEFLPGVGRSFFSFLIAFLLYILLFAAFFALAGIIGLKFAGIPSNSPDNLMSVLSNKQAMYDFVNSLSMADRIKYFKWNVVTLIVGNLFSILTMLWAPMIALCSLNPLKAFILNLKLMFKKPAQIFLIYIIYIAANMVLSLLSSISGANFLLQLISITLMFLFVLYFLMLLFIFVEDNNEDTRHSGVDCIG